MFSVFSAGLGTSQALYKGFLNECLLLKMTTLAFISLIYICAGILQAARLGNGWL
jgi:hypothetical protein